MAGLAGIASSYGPWAIGGTIALLALFWLLRGRIRIEKGWGGFNIVRFGRFERLVHWLLALSFVVALFSGLTFRYADRRYGQFLLVDFRDLALIGGWLHLLAGMAFIACLPLAFLLWVRHSLPHWRDAVWALKGGGMIVRGVHPPAHKFNPSQKVMFWLTMLGGALLSLTGAAMLLPGFIELLPLHIFLAVALTCAVIIHVYFRTIGIQGAASAMASGEVDANWAKQHHSLWAEQEIGHIQDAAEPKAVKTVASSVP